MHFSSGVDSLWSESGLAYDFEQIVCLLSAPPDLAWRQRLPAGYRPGAVPRQHIVGDARKYPAQLDDSRHLPATIEGGADRRSVSLGDGEHARRMGTRITDGKQRLASVYTRSGWGSDRQNNW